MSYTITGGIVIDEIALDGVLIKGIVINDFTFEMKTTETDKNVLASKILESTKIPEIIKLRETKKQATKKPINGQKRRVSRTDAMTCIIREKRLPDELHEVDLQDYCGKTMAMHWIRSVSPVTKSIPKCLIHDVDLQDINGKTMAMTWVHYVKTVPPEEIINSPNVIDKTGKTLQDHINKFVLRKKI